MGSNHFNRSHNTRNPVNKEKVPPLKTGTFLMLRLIHKFRGNYCNDTPKLTILAIWKYQQQLLKFHFRSLVKMAAHLTSGKVNLGLLRDFYRKEFLDCLDKCMGTKVFKALVAFKVLCHQCQYTSHSEGYSARRCVYNNNTQLNKGDNPVHSD